MAVLVAVILLHLLMGLLIVAASRKQTIRAPAQFLTLTYLPPPIPAVALLGRSPSPAPALRKIPPVSAPPSNSNAAEAQKSNTITVPGVDWDAAAGQAAKIRTDPPDLSLRNLAGPSQAELNRAHSLVTPHELVPKAGDSERAEGGQVLTWVSDKCFWTTQGIVPGEMAQTRKVCKDPPKPEAELFKDMRKQLDARESAREP